MKIQIDPALQRLIRRHERLRSRSSSELEYGIINGLTLRIDDDGELLLYRPTVAVPAHVSTFLDNLRCASESGRDAVATPPEAE